MRSWWSRVAKRLDGLRELRRPGDVALFLSIFGFAVATPVLLRLKLLRLQSLLEPKGAAPTPDLARVQKIGCYVDLALRLGRPLVRSGCLTRGLTLYYFVRRAGLEVTLCFGLGNLEDQFVGHCWLVKDGEPFMETRDPRPRFTEVYRIPNANGSWQPYLQLIGGRYHTDEKL